MDDTLLTIIVSLVSAPAGAICALGLERRQSRRRDQRALYEFHRSDDPSVQSWRAGLYDIRDWAIEVGSYLSSRDPSRLSFNTIRIPGARFIGHMIDNGRVPHDRLQYALTLQGYCELLDAAVAQVFARDLDDPPTWGQTHSGRVVSAWEHNTARPADPAIIQLAEAVEHMARVLIDPDVELRKIVA